MDDDMNIKIDRVVVGKSREIIAENTRLRALLRELVEAVAAIMDYEDGQYGHEAWRKLEDTVRRARVDVELIGDERLEKLVLSEPGEDAQEGGGW